MKTSNSWTVLIFVLALLMLVMVFTFCNKPNTTKNSPKRSMYDLTIDITPFGDANIVVVREKGIITSQHLQLKYTSLLLKFNYDKRTIPTDKKQSQ